MASLLYNSALRDEATGAIDYDSDTFYAMLLAATYTPDKDAHTKRSDVTAHEASGTGYTAGGQAVTVTVGAVDTTNDRVDITLGSTSWSAASITARYAVYYKRRGGADTADELVGLNDFGSNITSTSATFTLNASTLRKSNP